MCTSEIARKEARRTKGWTGLFQILPSLWRFLSCEERRSKIIILNQNRDMLITVRKVLKVSLHAVNLIPYEIYSSFF